MGSEGSSGRVPGGAQQQEPAPHYPAARRAGQDLSRLFQRLLAEAAPGGQEPAAGPAVHTRPADQGDRHRLTLPRESARSKGHQATSVTSSRSPTSPAITNQPGPWSTTAPAAEAPVSAAATSGVRYVTQATPGGDGTPSRAAGNDCTSMVPSPVPSPPPFNSLSAASTPSGTPKRRCHWPERQDTSSNVSRPSARW